MKSGYADMTPDEKYEAVVAQLRAKGIHVPPKGAWMKTAGSMAGSEHFDEAIRLGAEWRAAVNKRSIEEEIALGRFDFVLGPPPEAAPDCSAVFVAKDDEALVSDCEEDLPLMQKLKSHGVRLPPKYAYLNNFGRAKNDAHYEAAAKAGAEWRDEVNRKSLENFDLNHALGA